MRELKIDKVSREIIGERLEELHGDVVTIDSSLKNISVAWSQASDIAKLGALILLSGLLIEIIGATVLAGTHLATEQKDVFTLASTPGAKDLSMSDVNSEPRIDFLGSIASIMLFLGFVLQFSGTILVLSLPLWLAMTMVALAVIPGSLVLYYLLGQSYNQSRTEKLNVIIKNIKRNLFPVFGAKCSMCSRRVSFKDAHVFWALDPNSEKYPYLHTPHNMHFGHYDCLSSSRKYQQPKNRNEQLQPIEIYKYHIKEFIINEVPKMKVWWDEYRAYWAERRESEENLCNSEYTFIQILKEVKKLKPNKHLHVDQLSAPSSLQDGA